MNFNCKKDKISLPHDNGEFMDLNIFIENTLTQIIEGTKAACSTVQNNGSGCINPQGENALAIHVVSFDVALTVEESQNNAQENQNATGGRIQIAKIFGVSHNRGKINKEEIQEVNQSVCRIKFDIPVRLPATPNFKKDAQEAATAARDLTIKRVPLTTSLHR